MADVAVEAATREFAAAVDDIVGARETVAWQAGRDAAVAVIRGHEHALGRWAGHLAEKVAALPPPPRN